MPKIDLLLLPLLGGYIFLITFYITRFYHQRIERQRLIFNSTIFGVILSILILWLDKYVFTPFIPAYDDFLKLLNPLKYSGLSESVFIFLAAYPLAKFLNIVIPKKKALSFVVNKWGSDFEKIIWTSLLSKNDEEKLLMVTTKTNKVYIGFVNKISEPINHSHITIIPNFSGYRNKDTQELNITTSYLDVLSDFINNHQEKNIENKIGVIIPVSEVVLISKFSMEVFESFNTISPEKELNPVT